MNLKRLTYCLPTVVLLGCGGSSDDGVVRTFEIGAFKTECSAFIYFDCNTTRSADDTQWLGMYPGIAGFDFEWGYEYTVRFRDTPIDNPPQDSLGFNRELVEVVRKTPVPAGTEFTLALRASDPSSSNGFRFFTRLDATTFEWFFDTQISCLTPEVCSDLSAAVDQDHKFLATFTFRPELGLPIILTQIVCSEPNRYSRVLCGETIGLTSALRITDKFDQDATEFVLPEPIRFEIALTNTGSEAIAFSSSLCGDFEIELTATFTVPERQAWRHQPKADNCSVSGAPDRSILPGDSASLLFQWESADEALSPGEYRVKSWFYNQMEHTATITVL